MHLRMGYVLVIGMQWLKEGEEYEMGIQPAGITEGFMRGDLSEILEREEDGAAWRDDGAFEVVAGEKCRFRVEA